jgi:hypothetical protein
MAIGRSCLLGSTNEFMGPQAQDPGQRMDHEQARLPDATFQQAHVAAIHVAVQRKAFLRIALGQAGLTKGLPERLHNLGLGSLHRPRLLLPRRPVYGL